MGKIYNIFFLVAIGLVMIIAISACSKNEDDISGPTITIYKDNAYKAQLLDNDTIVLNDDYFLIIYIEATDKVNMEKMTLELINLSNPSLNHYGPKSWNVNQKTGYYYKKTFPLDDITEITRIELLVTCENHYKNAKTVKRKFYVKPSTK